MVCSFLNQDMPSLRTQIKNAETSMNKLVKKGYQSMPLAQFVVAQCTNWKHLQIKKHSIGTTPGYQVQDTQSCNYTYRRNDNL